MAHSYSSPPSLDAAASHLSAAEKDVLRHGEAVVTADGKQYTGQVLVNAPLDVVWDVITDYDRFSNFLPSIVSSQVLSEQGDRKVVEQVGSQQVLFTTVESRLQTENVETPKQRIDFRLLDGDLKQFEGHWQVYPIEQPDSGQQTLVMQTVEAEAGIGLLEGSFQDIFAESMKESLSALQQEIQQRSP